MGTLKLKTGVCIRVLPSLVAQAIGYETVVGAHNTIHVQMHLVGSTVFTWYGKHRCLQHYLCSDTSRRLYSVCLAWPSGTVLQVRRAWQGTVLGIAVDLSALSYLLRRLPRPTPSGRPQLVAPSWPRPCR